MDIVALFKNIPGEWAVFFMAMLPVAEVRVALPVALTVYDMPLASALIISIIGNLFPVVFILLFLDRVSRFLSEKSLMMKSFFEKLFSKTKIKYAAQMQTWGEIALITFVAIPLPFTGAWTGALIAFLMGFSFWKSLFSLAAGVCIAALIVLLSIHGIVSFF
ncbi:MAG: small multi-drug export protein [Parcubacteria group bacterium]|nr:small multi-drug export protein [Parcubacteria group bacterium]